MKPRDPLGRRSMIVMELADRPCGVTIREAATASGVEAVENISGRIGRMVHSGFLWRVVRHRATRFFSSPEAASAWNKANPVELAKPVKPVKVDRGYPIHLRRAPASKAKQRPAASAEAITPDGVKHTVCNAPTFDVRFQVDPNTRVVGGFSTMGIGRYIA